MGIRAALQGMGIGFPVEETVMEDIAQGRLVPLLVPWSAPFPGFFLCYPQQRQMAPALRAFIDAVRSPETLPSAGGQTDGDPRALFIS
jgi:DNA-binding transcriptional LysR family regulator